MASCVLARGTTWFMVYDAQRDSQSKTIKRGKGYALSTSESGTGEEQSWVLILFDVSIARRLSSEKRDKKLGL